MKKYEFHPASEIFPLMDKDGLHSLREDIRKHKLEVPIELMDGKIIDGRNRYLACTTEDGPVDELRFVDVSVADPVAYVISLNLHRRHLNESQRAMVGARAKEIYEKDAKDRKGKRTDLQANLPASGGKRRPQHQARDDAAKQTNVSARSVQNAATVIAKGSAKVIKAVDEGRLAVSKAVKIVEKPKAAQDAVVTQIEKSKQVSRVKGLTGEIEWYTPRMYLDSAAVVMNGIDLDPASSRHAQKHVKAKRFFTIDDDGLAKEWNGCIFLNPPYRMPVIRDFVLKLCEEYKAGRVSQAILLTNGATDTEWFHIASACSTSCCLTRGRISFIQCRDGEMEEKTSPTCGQAFFYFGRRRQAFEKEFRRHGSIYQLTCPCEIQTPDDE